MGSQINGGSVSIRYVYEPDGPNRIGTQAISWNANPATLAGNIQTAMNNMFGTGVTKVFLRTLGDSTTANPADYDINWAPGCRMSI